MEKLDLVGEILENIRNKFKEQKEVEKNSMTRRLQAQYRQDGMSLEEMVKEKLWVLAKT